MFDSTPNPLPLLLRRVIPPFLFFFFSFSNGDEKEIREGKWTNAYTNGGARERVAQAENGAIT